MKKLLVLCVTALFLGSCAQLSAAMGKAGVKAPVVKAPTVSVGGDLAKIQQVLGEAQELCGPLKTISVTEAEEREMGGAIALNLAKGTGVFIEISPEILNAKLDAGKMAHMKVSRPKGAKADLTAYVANVGKYLSQSSARPALPWTFVVLDDAAPNAFSAPGGYAFVTTGLLKMVENEAQLAGVLGHEIGHVTERHAINAYMKGKYEACYVSVTAANLLVALKVDMRGLVSALGLVGIKDTGLENWTPAELQKISNDMKSAAKGDSFKPPDPNGVGPKFVVFLTDIVTKIIKGTGFEKDMEFKSDAIAADLLMSAGYDAGEFQKLLTKLGDGKGTNSPHPSMKDRVAKIEERKAEYGGFALATPPSGSALSLLK